MSNGCQKSFFLPTVSRRAGGDVGSEKPTCSTNQVIWMKIMFSLFLLLLILNNWFFSKNPSFTIHGLMLFNVFLEPQ
jgi:hypothetical protein